MLNTKLLNVLGFLAIAIIFSLDMSVANDNLDDTLKQALFLVELLKSDFPQVLREKGDVLANYTEEENSTCSLPAEDINSTIAMNDTGVTASGVSSMNDLRTPLTLSTPPLLMQPGAPTMMPNIPPVAPMMMPNAQPGAPMMMPNIQNGAPMMMPNAAPGAPGAPMMMQNTPPGAPMMMAYATWPAMPMGYPPPSGPARRSFQDENYRFPYSFNRRRMMPDYYYYDPPVKSRGNFRRSGNEPSDGLVNTPAPSQAQTTASVSSAASEATTVTVGETTASATSLSTTISELSTSILPTNSANQSNLQANSGNQSILAKSDPTEQTVNSDQILTATRRSVLSSFKYTKKSILRTPKSKLRKIKPKSMKTKPRKRVSKRKRKPASKDKRTPLKKDIANGNKKHHNVRNRHLRQNLPTTEDYLEVFINDTGEFENVTAKVEDNQLAVELAKEMEDNNNKTYNRNEEETSTIKLIRISSYGPTMKVFLPGSSRMPVPFPENNAFCFFNPRNALCGTNK